MLLKVVPQSLGEASRTLASKIHLVDICVFGDELHENLDDFVEVSRLDLGVFCQSEQGVLFPQLPPLFLELFIKILLNMLFC